MCEALSESNKTGFRSSYIFLVAYFRLCSQGLWGLMFRMLPGNAFSIRCRGLQWRNPRREELLSAADMQHFAANVVFRQAMYDLTQSTPYFQHSLIIWIFSQVSENTGVDSVYCKTLFFILSVASQSHVFLFVVMKSWSSIKPTPVLEISLTEIMESSRRQRCWDNVQIWNGVSALLHL